VISKTKSQFSIVKKIINDPETEKLICATDAGREGELIFRLIYTQAKCKKPVDRLWISSMTDEAIKEGFANLKPASEYEGLYKSATCRSEADWLVGMNASRAFTLRFDALLSIGRVQTPTLAILVKRYHEIANFKPEEYYTVTADFGDYTGQWFDEKVADEKKANRIPNKEKADEIAKAVKGKAARVKNVTAEAKKELPPQLYDLTSLQREANRKLGFTADKTLKIAQELYEKWKAITYPRTDSRYLPMDMIPRTRQTLQKLPQEYKPLVENIPWKEDGKLPISKRYFDNEKISDHHAIIPTPQTAPVDKLPPDAKNLFDMIPRRLVAVFYPAHEYDAIKVITDCQGNLFKTTGRVVKVNGWKDVYPAENAEKSDKEEEAALPALKEGDGRTVSKATVKKETTKPPPPTPTHPSWPPWKTRARIGGRKAAGADEGQRPGHPRHPGGHYRTAHSGGLRIPEGPGHQRHGKGRFPHRHRAAGNRLPRNYGQMGAGIGRNRQKSSGHGPVHGGHPQAVYLPGGIRKGHQNRSLLPGGNAPGQGKEKSACCQANRRGQMPPVRQACAGKQQGLRLLRLAGGLPFYPVEGRLKARRRAGAERKTGEAGVGKKHGDGLHGHHCACGRQADLHPQGGGCTQRVVSHCLSKELSRKTGKALGGTRWMHGLKRRYFLLISYPPRGWYTKGIKCF
jgi:DNA topoisomerase IA